MVLSLYWTNTNWYLSSHLTLHVMAYFPKWLLLNVTRITSWVTEESRLLRLICHCLLWQWMSDLTLNDRCLERSDSPLPITSVSSHGWGWCVYITFSMAVLSDRSIKQGSEKIGWNEEPFISPILHLALFFCRSAVTLSHKLIKLPDAVEDSRWPLDHSQG